MKDGEEVLVLPRCVQRGSLRTVGRQKLLPTQARIAFGAMDDGLRKWLVVLIERGNLLHAPIEDWAHLWARMGLPGPYLSSETAQKLLSGEQRFTLRDFFYLQALSNLLAVEVCLTNVDGTPLDWAGLSGLALAAHDAQLLDPTTNLPLQRQRLLHGFVDEAVRNGKQRKEDSYSAAALPAALPADCPLTFAFTPNDKITSYEETRRASVSQWSQRAPRWMAVHGSGRNEVVLRDVGGVSKLRAAAARIVASGERERAFGDTTPTRHALSIMGMQFGFVGEQYAFFPVGERPRMVRSASAGASPFSIEGSRARPEVVLHRLQGREGIRPRRDPTFEYGVGAGTAECVGGE